MVDSSSGKIAFVARVYGHLAAFHLPFIKLLQDMGYEVHAYAGADHAKSELETHGVVCHTANFRRSALALGNFGVMRQLRQEFAAQGFAMMHCNTPIASFVARIAAWQAKVPAVIYTVHGFHFRRGGPMLDWLIYYPLERLSARLTDYLITLNQEDFALATKFRVRREVEYIHGIGLDIANYQVDEKRAETRLELNLAPSDICVLCVAELNRNKNQIQLIAAVQSLVSTHPELRCFLVGEGEDYDWLASQITTRGLATQVTLLGFRRDVPELLAASDVVALTSRREGLPKALMEAMAAGKPIVATNIRGSRDLVHEGTGGYLVSVHDNADTAAALARLLNDASLRARMGEANRQRVQAYDVKNVLKKMAQIYTRALQPRL